jgi:hypothetical protein
VLGSACSTTPLTSLVGATLYDGVRSSPTAVALYSSTKFARSCTDTYLPHTPPVLQVGARLTANARRSASAAERSAAADERQIEMATTYHVPWRLQHDSGSACLLFTDGDEAAEAAMLTSGSSAQSGIIVEAHPPDVQPHKRHPLRCRLWVGCSR